MGGERVSGKSVPRARPCLLSTPCLSLRTLTPPPPYISTRKHHHATQPHRRDGRRRRAHAGRPHRHDRRRQPLGLSVAALSPAAVCGAKRTAARAVARRRRRRRGNTQLPVQTLLYFCAGNRISYSRALPAIGVETRPGWRVCNSPLSTECRRRASRRHTARHPLRKDG